METVKTMTKKNLLVFLVTVFALALAVQSVSAFGTITSVEVNGVEALGTTIDFANFAGEKVPVLVRFTADDGTLPSPDDDEELADDATIAVWLSGDRTHAVESEEFVVLENRTYTRTVFLTVPFDLDDDLSASRKLEVVVESEKEGTADAATIDLTVQRESYFLEILAVTMQPEIKAGDSLVIDAVIKNRGSQLAEDTFLRVSIPELGLETRTFYGDLSALDQGGDVIDREDSVEKRTYLRIPSNVPVGLYDVVIEAFNDDSISSIEKRVLIGGAVEDTIIVTPATAKEFSTGETGIYKLTIVNRGDVVRIYEIVLDASTGLDIDLEESIVVVPAGSSRTIEISATSDTADDYTFTAIVHSDGKVVSDETFTASIIKGDGKKSIGTGATNSTAVLLTVILAIVFVVLLVVLIVLLTKKPEKSEEFGESYY
jgi:hypothetical protein